MKELFLKKVARTLVFILMAYFSSPSFATDMSSHASLGCMSCHMDAAMPLEKSPNKSKGHLLRPQKAKTSLSKNHRITTQAHS